VDQALAKEDAASSMPASTMLEYLSIQFGDTGISRTNSFKEAERSSESNLIPHRSWSSLTTVSPGLEISRETVTTVTMAPNAHRRHPQKKYLPEREPSYDLAHYLKNTGPPVRRKEPVNRKLTKPKTGLRLFGHRKRDSR